MGGPSGWPKIFFSNAGAPPAAGPKLQSYASAQDFRDWLVGQFWSASDYDFCAVPNTSHAQGYLYNSRCLNDTTQVVIASMVDFFVGAGV